MRKQCNISIRAPASDSEGGVIYLFVLPHHINKSCYINKSDLSQADILGAIIICIRTNQKKWESFAAIRVTQNFYQKKEKITKGFEVFN